MKCDGPFDAAMQVVPFGIQWESRLLPLQKVKCERGWYPRKEMDDILPFWIASLCSWPAFMSSGRKCSQRCYSKGVWGCCLGPGGSYCGQCKFVRRDR